jgi:POT family proton-dependent oligopeptide transporter
MELLMPQINKHPKGLYFLFFTEMWERFSFYGINGILVLYLTKHLTIAHDDASLVSGAYMAFTFLAPIIGGWVADKLIGYIWSVIIGASLIFLGNVILALPLALNAVYLGLATIAVGTGFLKSTISVLVGQLYQTNDQKRDSAYTLFYMGINLGSILAGLIIAYIAEKINWYYGFALAALGMLVGLIIFITGYKKGYFSQQSNIIKSDNLRHKIIGINGGTWLLIGTCVFIYFMFYLLSDPANTKIVITMISFAMLFYILFLALRSKSTEERKQLLSILVFIITAIFFWSLYKQSFNSLALFIDHDINRVFMGITIPTSMFVLVPNSIFIILLASLFAKIWLKLAEKGNNPSAPVKFLIGLLFTLASFITFTLSAYLAYTSGVASSMLWPLVGIFLLTCAELCISPVGLSIVSEMSPKHLSGFLMGAWFLASSIGSYVSGLLSSFVHIPRGMNNVIISAHAYFNLFSRCSLAMAIVIIIFILLLPLIKRLTNKNLI